MSTLTEEQIEYIREWAASGNEWREVESLRAHLMGSMYYLVRWNFADFCRLTPAGLTIAAQAERILDLEAAREKAEVAREVARLSELLSSVVWVQPSHNGSPSCSCCGAQEHWGHEAGCEIAEFDERGER